MNGIRLENSVFLPQVCKLVDEGKTVSINLRGNSMRPFLETDRDVGILSKSDGFKKGQVVLAEIDPGHFVLHRIDKIVSQGKNVNTVCCDKEADVTLRGDGNVCGTEHCKLGEVRALCDQVIRNGKKWTLSKSIFWKAYSWWWTHTIFIRRYQLALYRLVWRHELPARFKRHK